MDKRNHRTSRTRGMNTWRAGCSESCTSGSEGGPQNPTSRNADRALRSDPYTEHLTPEKAECSAVACSMLGHERLLAGRSTRDRQRPWSTQRWRWPSQPESRREGWWFTRITARNTPRGRSAATSGPPASCSPSGPSAMRMTTRWSSHCGDGCKPSC